jgi:hypothetical protein
MHLGEWLAKRRKRQRCPFMPAKGENKNCRTISSVDLEAYLNGPSSLAPAGVIPDLESMDGGFSEVLDTNPLAEV